MLSIQPPRSAHPPKVTPNLLPLRISHNGPINSTGRFFTPTTSSTDASSTAQHAHFRGRHLHGTPVALPEGYTGAVLHITDQQLPQGQSRREQQRQEVHHRGESGAEDEDEDADAGDMFVEVKVAEHVAEFDEIVVWGHGGIVDQSRDIYVRGLTEWVGFAESMHYEQDEQGTDGNKA
ncbi:ribonuclease H1 small subunit [Plenodomus tracheiphilus IPT5]|uniref:Ribonuclease H1 small subunit n=1 Tax=Plenodomus tracheiphilus IPT5 TaxID=1408161 RepID=A0A6A7AR63_9PLEO|nr:ribonuclease H1 small subunit [Plenodomus tracheiphilus IPT5]